MLAKSGAVSACMSSVKCTAWIVLVCALATVAQESWARINANVNCHSLFALKLKPSLQIEQPLPGDAGMVTLTLC